MTIYEDQNLTKPIDRLDLGIVPGGETRRYSLWIMNDNGTLVKDLKFSVDHKEVKIIQAPEQMQPLERHEIILEWTPSVTLKEGLKTELKLNGIELWS
jgi:hypothetical protein